MSQASKIALALQMIESAESNLSSAKNVLNEVTGGKRGKAKLEKAAETLSKDLATEDEEDSIIEGVFDGQNMIGPDKKSYPIPANYASKSKLISGDILKLTITPDGSFLYKQIGPAERDRIVGTLTYEDNQYKVVANGTTYRVLLASVTYFQAEVGDKITLIIPKGGDSEWGAIENTLPKEDDVDIDQM
ncbi:MAG: hypothetical protein ABH856_00080 [Patescibacteria group bacterium]